MDRSSNSSLHGRSTIDKSQKSFDEYRLVRSTSFESGWLRIYAQQILGKDISLITRIIHPIKPFEELLTGTYFTKCTLEPIVEKNKIEHGIDLQGCRWEPKLRHGMDE